MKKLRAALAAILAVAVIFVFAGCNKTIETVEGVWLSPDGYTLTLDADTLTLTDQLDADVLGAPMRYYWDGDSIYVTIDSVTVRAFSAYLDEDTLTLDYSEELISMMSAGEQKTIVLERSKQKIQAD